MFLCFLFFMEKKVVDDIRDGVGGEVAIGYLSYLNSGGKCAAAEAGNFFERKEALFVSVIIFFDLQMPFEGVVYLWRPFYMAGGPDAYSYGVFSGGSMAELVVES